ncbi:MAG: hypothetical protein WBP45_11800 [Daejeonella sp.]
METIIVSPKTKAEFKLLTDILHKMKIAAKVLTDEQKEDIGLGMMMKEADRGKKVSREIIMKTLKDS